ncbi:MAG TPA: 2-C-methyl-D-erythritol 4-phosphate cytidylyltransferase [Solirubrobacteraceae bacterium]
MDSELTPAATATALVVAAGSGQRLGADRPKALVELAGKTLLQWSVEALAAASSVTKIIVALPAGVEDAPEGTIGVRGGSVRSESVRNALAVAGDAKIVLVHDAARPLLKPELVERTVAAVKAPGVDAAIAAIPVTDTIKRVGSWPAPHALPRESSVGLGQAPALVEPERELPLVHETLRRDGLWAVQTPQAFRRDALERALDVPAEVLAEATDDAWLVERQGGSVVLVVASHENLKITTPLDLELAMLLLGGSR